MAKNSKGSSFEREICKVLSLWWSKGERSDLLMRNRVRSTQVSPDALNQLGDITAQHTSIIPFVEMFNVELKTGYSKTRKGTVVKNRQWDLLEVIDGSEEVPTILKFWEQCKRDALLSKRYPMLIFKRDHRTPVVCLPIRVAAFLCEHYQGIALRITGLADNDLILYNLKDFLEYLPPRDISYNLLRRKRDKK